MARNTNMSASLNASARPASRNLHIHFNLHHSISTYKHSSNPPHLHLIRFYKPWSEIISIKLTPPCRITDDSERVQSPLNAVQTSQVEPPHPCMNTARKVLIKVQREMFKLVPKPRQQLRKQRRSDDISIMYRGLLARPDLFLRPKMELSRERGGNGRIRFWVFEIDFAAA